MGTSAMQFPWRRQPGDEREEGGASAGVEADGAQAPITPGPHPDEGGKRPSTPDGELRARREEIARMEEVALRETQSLAVRAAEVERRAQALADRERNLAGQNEELKQAKSVQRRELERLSGLSAAQAKQMLLADVEQEANHQAALRIRQIEEEARRDGERRARNILAVATQRLASKHVTETTTRLIELPNEEMKGRIIGREGRNIRALEKLTGVDVIIDETPQAVLLSSFDGVRREIARMTIERLIADGRINPALIEETYEAAVRDVDAEVLRHGQNAALEAHVDGLDPELIMLLGRLRFRTSYGQNVLDHLVECAHLAALLAAELGASVETSRRAAFLHDIGKAVTHEIEGPHAVVGARFARRRKEPEAVAHAMEAHHNEVAPKTVEAVIVQAADAVSGARPGARGDTLEQYVGRMRDLEGVAERHHGVERVYAMRAGREIRVVVDPGEVDDDRAAVISHEIAAAIEKEVEQAGRVKITVIRESRSTTYAGTQPGTSEHPVA